MSVPGGDRRQLTFFEDAVRAAPFHPNSGDYIEYAKDSGGGEWYQLYRSDLASGVSTLLTDGKSRNLMGLFSSRGDLIAYVSTRRTGKDTDLWVMNPAELGSDHLLTQLEGGGWTPLEWSPDDSRILLQEQISIDEIHLWLVDTTSGEKTAVTPREEKNVAYGEGRFSRDGKGLYVTTDRDSEFQRLTYLPFDTRAHHYLSTAIAWDVEHIEVSRDGQYLAVVTNEGGGSARYLMPTKSNVLSRVRDLPGGVIDSIHWDGDGRQLAVSLSNARMPGDVYSVGVPDGKIMRWTQSETAVPTAGLRAAELVKWKSFDGRTISGFLYRPPARFGGKRPVLVIIHGGPEGQARPDFLGRSGYYVNELGIAVLEPNVRGSTGYGKSFDLLDNGFLREGAYKDINALLDWIQAQPDLDCESRGRWRRQLRWPHDTRGFGVLQRSYPLLGGCRGSVESGHLPRAHRGVPARPAPGRIRRRARPEDARVPRAYRADEQRWQDQEAHAGRRGQKRSARACERERPDCRGTPQPGNPGVVHRRKGRGTRIPEETQPGLPALRDSEVPRAVSRHPTAVGCCSAIEISRRG